MIGKLKKHNLRSIWKNEAKDFTVWLESNLDSIAEATGIDLSLVKREHSVGPFSVDILAKDDQGNQVVIENQLEKTDHTHLGQILTYVSNTECKTLIWISSEPRQEHINAVNWLNTHTPISFYLLKMEAISIDDSKAAPYFQIISRPDNEIKIAAANATELSERERFNLNFWTEMSQRCEGKLPGFVNLKPSKYHFLGQAAGRGGFRFVFLATSKFYGIELYIDVNDADANEILLNQLKDEKEKIEKEYGSKLDFDEIPEKRACRIRHVVKDNCDVTEMNIIEVQTDLIKAMVKFESVFKNRIKNLKMPEINEAA